MRRAHLTHGLLLLALAAAGGCREKSTADLAKEAQEASGEVADQQKDLQQAEERLKEEREDREEEARELERAQDRAQDTKAELDERARADSIAAAAPRRAAPGAASATPPRP